MLLLIDIESNKSSGQSRTSNLGFPFNEGSKHGFPTTYF